VSTGCSIIKADTVDVGTRLFAAEVRPPPSNMDLILGRILMPFVERVRESSRNEVKHGAAHFGLLAARGELCFAGEAMRN
jgi:hypothetical protein